MADYAQIVTFQKSTATGTYGEVQINLPQYPDGSVPCIVAIEIEHPILLANDDTSEWAVTTKSGSTAVSNLDNAEVIARGKRTFTLDANGSLLQDCMERVDFKAPIPITSPTLFAQFLQDVGTITYRGRIHFVPRNIPGLVQRTVQSIAQF